MEKMVDIFYEGFYENWVWKQIGFSRKLKWFIMCWNWIDESKYILARNLSLNWTLMSNAARPHKKWNNSKTIVRINKYIMKKFLINIWAALKLENLIIQNSLHKQCEYFAHRHGTAADTDRCVIFAIRIFKI